MSTHELIETDCSRPPSPTKPTTAAKVLTENFLLLETAFSDSGTDRGFIPTPSSSSSSMQSPIEGLGIPRLGEGSDHAPSGSDSRSSSHPNSTPWLGDAQSQSSLEMQSSITNGPEVDGGDTLSVEDEDHGADSDSDLDNHGFVINPEGPRKVSEKKRADAAVFRSWIVQNQKEVRQSFNATEINLDGASVGRLLQNSTNKKIIASPREYQIELFERAKKKNTIVVLDTGSGKTLIAALLLRHILEQELEDRALGKKKKVAFFLVEKVALCFQQFAVLECNLEHPIAKFYGEMTGSMRTKEYWDRQFDDHMAVVCTADILLGCLNDGFIRMNEINLLIFDEAHHAKKNHPYARIIKDNYMRESGERPRILGMTASPVDTQTRDIRESALELESMLCSEIATVSDESLTQSLANRQQTETISSYARLGDPEDMKTPLRELISNQVIQNPQFKVSLEFTKEASAHLGGWCADRYWQLLMTESETARLAARTDRDSAYEFGSTRVEQRIKAVRSVQKIVDEYDYKPVAPWTPELSHKVNRLYGILEDAFRLYDTKRCIVFVEQRNTACLLADLFQQPGMRIPGMVVAHMVGCQSITSNFGNMSFRDQVLALSKFRRGETNCLFATPVAEEGIDVPDCDLIVRFDLYNSMIQYIQSKGRARQLNSRYINMIEEDNMQHWRMVHKASRDANTLRRFCSALPADRKVEDPTIDDGLIEYEQINPKVYEVPSTGARLTYSHSLAVLAKFVSSIAPPGDAFASPDYLAIPYGRNFIADVILPDYSPIKCQSGYPQRSKLLARCSAAFELCVELIKKRYIDGHFQPVFKKKLPAMRNARLAVSDKKRSEYSLRLKPELWLSLGDGIPTKLFATVLILDNPDAVGRSSRPLVLLSRKQFPELHDISLFFGNGHTSLVRCASKPGAMSLSTEVVQSLSVFTLKILGDVFSKHYEDGPADIPYFLAPSALSHAEALSAREAEIDWPLVRIVQENEYLDWEDAPEEFFHDKFLVDVNDGSRKMIAHGINRSLKPSDPTPEGVPEPKNRAYRFVEHNIKEYSNSLWLKSRAKVQWRDDQPVVNAELLSLQRNFLDEFSIDEEVNNRCYVILEPLKVSPLPADVVAMALAFPAIIHRIDSALIALDACAMLNLAVPPALALEAFTKDSDNTGEHGEEQVNFQAGMGNNYERLEFLGDSFLKMATTISLFTLIPESNEFEYHVERMLLICNQNLFNHAVERNLQEYIRSKSFDRRAWYPNLKKLTKGKAPKTQMRHNLSDKSIADVCEALIGAAYLASGEGKFDLAVKAVTEMVQSTNHAMQSFGDYYLAFRVPAWQSGPSSAAQRFVVEQVATTTGYRFRSAPLLRSAFKHPSYPYEPIPHYQRLEFLGDSLLDMAIVDYLFKHFPAADPQWLTEHKMAMASNQFFGCVCVKLGLHKHLLVTSSSMINKVREYVAELEQAEEDALQEALKQGTAMRRDFWLNAAHPPKALPDIVEALVGAMFVDAKYDYAVVDDFFSRFILPYFEDMALYDTFANKHPVTFLARTMQQDLMCADWRLCTSNIPCSVDEGVAALTESDVVCALMVHEKVVLHATCKSGRYAKIAVAKKALTMFEGMGKEQFKLEMGCDCKGATVFMEAKAGGVGNHGTAI